MAAVEPRPEARLTPKRNRQANQSAFGPESENDEDGAGGITMALHADNDTMITPLGTAVTAEDDEIMKLVPIQLHGLLVIPALTHQPSIGAQIHGKFFLGRGRQFGIAYISVCQATHGQGGR